MEIDVLAYRDSPPKLGVSACLEQLQNVDLGGESERVILPKGHSHGFGCVCVREQVATRGVCIRTFEAGALC